MRTSIKISLAAMIGLGSIFVAPAAWAGCGDIAGKQPASWNETSRDALFQRADYGATPIVGMWAVTFTVGGNKVDFGYAQWHSDGTEFMNSGGRAPSTQNYCMGVWAQTGPSRYHLNHFALSYDTSGTLTNKVNIREDVTVDGKGGTYSGPFTIDIYDLSGTTIVAHIAGQVTGQRLTAN